MPDVSPFRGIRYSSSSALGDLICPPYDVVSADDVETLLARHPHNAAHLEAASVHGVADHDAIAATFRGWIDEGALVRDGEDTFYVYRQDFELDGQKRSVAGVVGALALEPFGQGVLPHERTMPGPKKDRLGLLRACRANLSPIYAIYRGSGSLRPFLESLPNRPAAARVVDDAGTLHRLWNVTAPAETEMLRSALAPGPLVVADGHHRYETALAYHQEEPGDPGRGAVLCWCVDADSEELEVLPYHRWLHASEGPTETARRLERAFPIRRVEDAMQAVATSDAAHPLGFVFPDEELIVELDEGAVAAALAGHDESWAGLDVVVLHEIVLPRVTGDALELGFARDPGELRRKVRSGEATAAVLLRPVGAGVIVDVAASGERMPQKASYFWPKAATGLVFRSLD